MSRFDYSTRSPYELWDYVHTYRTKYFEPSRPANAKELKAATEAALALRRDYPCLPEVPLPKHEAEPYIGWERDVLHAEYVSEQDFIRLEQWFLTAKTILDVEEQALLDAQIVETLNEQGHAGKTGGMAGDSGQRAKGSWEVPWNDEDEASKPTNKHKSERKARKKTPPQLLKETRERHAANALAKNPDMTARELADQLGCVASTVVRLKAWKNRGLLHRDPPRAQHEDVPPESELDRYAEDVE